MMFMSVTPSLLASACICAAARGVNAPSAQFALRDVCLLTQVDPLEVEFTVRHIEAVVAKETAALQKQQSQALKQQSYPNISSPMPSKISDGGMCDDLDSQPETPTDVQDVSF